MLNLKSPAPHIAAITLLAALVFAAWGRVIITPGGLNDWDLSFPLTFSDHLRNEYPLWNPAGSNNQPVLPALVVNLLWAPVAGILSSAGGDFPKFIQLVTAIWMAVAAYLGAILVCQTVAPTQAKAHRLALVAGAIGCAAVYSFNPWMLSHARHFYMWVGFASAPLTLALVIRGLVHKSRRPVLLAALLHALVGSASPHSGAFVFGVVLAACVFHAAVGFSPESVNQRFRSALGRALEFGAMYLASSAFFLFPTLSGLANGVNLVPGYLLVQQDLQLLVRHQSWINTVRLLGDWYWSPIIEAKVWQIWRQVDFAILPPVFLVIGTAAFRSFWRVTVFFVSLAGATALFMSAAATPTVDVFFRDTVVLAPLGWLLREPDKLGGVIALAYSLGIGLVIFAGLAALTENLGVVARLRAATIGIVGTAAVAVTIGYSLPSIQGVLWDSQTANLPRSVPADYESIAQILNRRAPSTAGRLLILGEGRVRFWSDGRIVEPFLGRSLAMRSVSSNSVLGRTFAGRVEQLIRAGDDPRSMLRSAGFTLLAVEADYPAGQSLRYALISLGYAQVHRGETATLFHVPLDLESPSVAAAPISVASDIGLTTGIPTISLDNGSGYVSVDYPSPALVTTDLIRQFGPVRSAVGDREVQQMIPATARLIPAIDATLNADPTIGWARGVAVRAPYSRWRDTLDNQGLENWQFDMGLGLIFTQGRSKVDVPLPRDLEAGTHQVWARVFFSPASQELRLRILRESGRPRDRSGQFPEIAVTTDRFSNVRETPADGVERDSEIILATDIFTRSGAASFEWRLLGSISVDKNGRYSATLDAGPGMSAINALALTTGPVDSQYSSDPTVSRAPPKTTWRRVSSTKYVATVEDADAPFLLILHEHFDPQWIARIGDETLRPVLAAGISNGYVISKSGSFSIYLVYEGQGAYDLGIGVSAFVSLAAIAWIVGFPLRQIARRAGRTLARARERLRLI